MPAAFLECVRRGGKVRTESLSGKKYMHVCVKPPSMASGKRGGRTVSGEVKTKKGY